MQDPFDLNPSQDISNLDKYRLVRDNPATGSRPVPVAPPGGYPSETASGSITGMPGSAYDIGKAQAMANRGMNPYEKAATGLTYGQMANNGMYQQAMQNGGMGQKSTAGIYQTLQEMEQLRKSINSRYIFMGIALVAPLFIAIFGAGRMLKTRSLPILMVILMFIVILALMPGIKKKRERLKALYKETFVKQLLMEHFQDVYYDWRMGFDEMWVKRSGLVRLGNRYHSEDYLCAVWRGVRFEQADVTIQYHTSSGKSSHTTTYFEGRMFSFDYTRKQTMPVQIHTKDFRYAGNPENGFKLQKVEMEDVDFNKQFVAAAMSPHDAFYILTPAMMQRLKYLRQNYGRVTVMVSQQKLYIGLDNRMDSFDAQTNRAIEYPRERERMEQDVRVIEALIEVLNCMP